MKCEEISGDLCIVGTETDGEASWLIDEAQVLYIGDEDNYDIFKFCPRCGTKVVYIAWEDGSEYNGMYRGFMFQLYKSFLNKDK